MQYEYKSQHRFSKKIPLLFPTLIYLSLAAVVVVVDIVVDVGFVDLRLKIESSQV